jgi:hypothetical protein
MSSSSSPYSHKVHREIQIIEKGKERASEVCPNFLYFGKCQVNHEERDSAAKTHNVMKVAFFPKNASTDVRKLVLCFYWLVGSCKNKTVDCPYAHGVSDLRRSFYRQLPVPKAGKDGTVIHPTLCTNFLFGRCDSKKCPYPHGFCALARMAHLTENPSFCGDWFFFNDCEDAAHTNQKNHCVLLPPPNREYGERRKL